MTCPERTIYVKQGEDILFKKKFKKEKKASAFIQKWLSKGFAVLFF